MGRESELTLLDRAWEDPGIHVFTLTAFGGTGKSALVSDWIDLLSKRNFWDDEVAALAWPFSNQETETSADFFEHALGLFGDPNPSQGTLYDRGVRLATCLQEKRWRTLLVLDGVESLQHPYTDGPLAGQLKDDGLSALLRELALKNRGLCVVTTQYRIRNLDTFPRAAPQHPLDDLPEDEGVTLLQRLTGITRRTQDVYDAVSAAKRHALTLTLLGNFLARAHPGNFGAWRQVGLREADGPQGVAARMIAAYAERLDSHMLAILRVLALFDRPVDIKILRDLQARPLIPGLTDGLVGHRERERRMAVQELRRQGLLVTGRNPDSLDAHPLVRSYFARELEDRQKEAWQAGHRLLYDLSRNATESLGSMQSLFDAMIHGCRAGCQQEVFDEVYEGKIRKRNGSSSRHLGASGSELTALAAFFDPPWDNPSAGLTAEAQALVLNEAGLLLRNLGRLGEAVVPLELSLKKWETFPQEEQDAATIAGNLSELTLTLGKVEEAVEYGNRSVELAKRGKNSSAGRVTGLARVADALHQAGRLAESSEAFREAERLQAEHRPNRPRLSAFRGYQYCDLLLSLGEPTDGSMLDGLHASPSKAAHYREACEEVVSRANETLLRAETAPGTLGGALDHLALGQAKLGLAVTAARGEERGFQAALEDLDKAVEQIRQRHLEGHLPRALLARARFQLYRSPHRSGDLEQARRDLQEALEIADSGPMRLHGCDAHCGLARLHLLQGNPQSADHHIREARELIKETGYLRRERHVDYLEDCLELLLSEMPPSPGSDLEIQSSTEQEAPLPSVQPTVFICYSHKDRILKDELVEQLSALEFKKLTVWDDTKIAKGKDWFPEIVANIERAQVAIFMVSASFLNSTFIRDEEVPRLLDRRKKEGLLVLPLLVRSCPWRTVTWLAEIQSFSRNRPLAQLGKSQREEELTALVYEISKRVHPAMVR